MSKVSGLLLSQERRGIFPNVNDAWLGPRVFRFSSLSLRAKRGNLVEVLTAFHKSPPPPSRLPRRWAPRNNNRKTLSWARWSLARAIPFWTASSRTGTAKVAFPRGSMRSSAEPLHPGAIFFRSDFSPPRHIRPAGRDGLPKAPAPASFPPPACAEYRRWRCGWSPT